MRKGDGRIASTVKQVQLSDYVAAWKGATALRSMTCIREARALRSIVGRSQPNKTRRVRTRPDIEGEKVWQHLVLDPNVSVRIKFRSNLKTE